MIRRSLVVGVDDLSRFEGAIICRDVSAAGSTGGPSIRRGSVLDATLRARLGATAGLTVEVVVGEAGEVPQPEGSLRIATALAGNGVLGDPPHQGQVVIRASRDGILRVSGDLVRQINLDDTVLVGTALDGRVVTRDETIAIVKAARLWVGESDVTRSVAAVSPATQFRVAPFVIRRASFLAGQRIRAANVSAAAAALRKNLGAFGCELVAVDQVGDEPRAIARMYREQQARGAEVILVAGSIVLDPGDPFLVALEEEGATIVNRGAPIDPGTMFWVAYQGATTLFGLASCEMYGRLSVLDLVLPFALAKEPITRELLAELGYGGLLQNTFAARRGSAAFEGSDDDDASSTGG